MKIAFITSEAYPFVKTGGLADVAYSLPRALSKLGHDVLTLMPRYYRVDKERFQLKLIHAPLGVPMGFDEKWGAVFESHFIPEMITYFLEHDNYFGRDGLYDNGYDAYPDNAERFAFFCHGTMEVLKALDFEPDIIHCNDWQTGLIPVYRKTLYAHDPFFTATRTVMTVHNVGYQGVFDKGNLYWTQLGWDLFHQDGLEYYDQVNYLKGGILYADAVTTVSRRYAREIQFEEYGYNLAGVFRKAGGRLRGITNGVDYGKWNPSRDEKIPAVYSVEDMKGKALCKKALQKRMGLRIDGKIPLMGTISRLTYQKGMDVLAETLETLLQENGVQFAILGSGEEWIVRWYEYLKGKYPERVGLYWGYDEDLAHLMEAGLDIYLMPSRYEPCGLNQMYSLKYGTIPVVRATGGLDDTISQWDGDSLTGNGFKFDDLNSRVLGDVIRSVLPVFHDKKQWSRLQQNAVAYHNSWEDTAREYLKVYEDIASSS